MLKREQDKAVEDTMKVVNEAKSIEDKIEAVETLQEVEQQVTTQEFKRLLDETKKNVRKSIDEARKQIPQYSNVVKNNQEQALESTGKMVEEYIDAQKSIIDSVFSTASAYYENATRIFNYWYSPKVPAETWARSVSNITENTLAATRIANDVLYGNINVFGNAFEQAQRHSAELTKTNVNNAKTIANTAKETAVEFSTN